MYVRAIWIALLSTIMMAMNSMAIAATYGPNDVEYVTSSRDRHVISYIICLNTEVGNMPRNVPMSDALDDAADNCHNAGFVLTSSPVEPDSRDIKAAIMECGFRPGEGRRGAVCGASARTPPFVAAPVCPSPKEFRNGRCRTPVVTAPVCPSPQEFRNGRCRMPAKAATPTCPPSQVWRNGRCR